MSIYEPWMSAIPHHLRGRLQRVTVPLLEDGDTLVYLQIQEVEGDLKGTEAALTFRVSKSLSLDALLARPGDIVTVEWIPDNCIAIGDQSVAIATKFHLSRNVDKAFGDGFVAPSWYPGR